MGRTIKMFSRRASKTGEFQDKLDTRHKSRAVVHEKKRNSRTRDVTDQYREYYETLLNGPSPNKFNAKANYWEST